MNSPSKCKQIARGLMSLVAVVPLAFANDASAAKSGNFTYEVKDSAVTITGFPVDFKGAVAIPAKIEGKPVKKIGDYAFHYCRDVTGVAIPAGVTIIGEQAFSECNSLKNMELPAGLVRFGLGAFAYTDLRKVKIPAGVKTISAGAFTLCSRLKEVEIPEGVEVIEPEAFSYCSMLETLDLPASVTNVTAASFAITDLKRINVATGNRRYSSVDGILYNKDRTLLISCPVLKSGSVKIPAGVKRLGEKSFLRCRNLKSVELPKGLLAIEARAFDECNSLAQVNLPDGVTDIGHHAFVHTPLVSVTIPASVDRIGGYAFVSCGAKSIYFKGDAPSQMGTGVFDSTSKSGKPYEGRTIYFYEGAKGFTEPKWMGYDTVSLDPDTPAANRLVFGSSWPD
ncbi:MAG: leucine-rich repeat domain-containing protein [Verrucomicrobiota bacterium]